MKDGAAVSATPALIITTPEEVDGAYVTTLAAARAAGLSLRRAAPFATAVADLAQSALSHGSEVRLEIAESGGEAPVLEAVLEHGGPALDLRQLEDSEADGRGGELDLARRVLDEIDVECRAGRTQVRAAIRLSTDAPSKAPRAGTERTGEAAELRRHGRELARALVELEEAGLEVDQAQRELEETNKGVVALYAELDDHAAELRLADERKDEFLAMLAHELRTPLGALGVASEVLEELAQTASSAMDPQATRAHATIRRQVSNLSRMVDDLLDVSRITQGKVQLRRRNVDINRCVEHVVDSLRSAVDAAGHELVVATSDESLVTNADPTRYEQIASNLIDNAVKYTSEPGRVTVETEAVTRDGNRWAELRVTDTGAGIAPERLGDVFGLFVQFDRTLGRARGGLGLGLTLVRRLAEMHGGEVEARSEGPGQGSTFIVRLPLLEGAAAQGRPRPTPMPERVEKRTILLVEDNDDLRELTAWKLRRRGYEVVEASDGAEALEIARDRPPDIALVDLGLPLMDGIELASKLRGDVRTSHVKLVALTGYGAAADVQRTRDAGFSDHMVKPVDVDELLLRLQGGDVNE